MNRILLYVCAGLVLIMGMFGVYKLVHRNDAVVAAYGPEERIYSFGPVLTTEVGVRESVSTKTGPVKIRLLIVKHCHERMADDDANLASQAASRAASKGLDIKVIGNTYADSIGEFQQIVEREVKKDAVPGDTLIVHTIGHGFPSGSIQFLGARSGVAKVLADAAGKNNQEILWWQLSCYAASGLPNINDYPEDQQHKFSEIASSTKNQTSPTREQAGIMGKVFDALATNDRSIDPNGDQVITAGELRAFLNGLDGRRRGDLLFARNQDEALFGQLMLASLIPIIDRNNPQGRYPDNYIPLPGGR